MYICVYIYIYIDNRCGEKEINDVIINFNVRKIKILILTIFMNPRTFFKFKIVQNYKKVPNF